MHGEERIKVGEIHFLTSLEIESDGSEEGAKILKEDGVDLEELMTYIEPMVIVRIRNKNFKGLRNNYKRIVYKMRRCTTEDFTSRHYIVQNHFQNSIKNRLCPDIKREEELYYV